MTGGVELELVGTETAHYKGERVNLPVYVVTLDGKPIGKVGRLMLTRERRTPGRRYVNARWQSPGWSYTGSVQPGAWLRWECRSRRDGIERLLREAGVSWPQVESLALGARTSKVAP